MKILCQTSVLSAFLYMMIPETIHQHAAMDEETFALFLQYQMSVCERLDLLGASAHTVDILQK